MAARVNRLAPKVIAADRSTLLAIQGLSDYQPVNNAYNVATIQQYEMSLTQAEQAVIRAQEALDQARVAQMEAAQAFHGVILGAKAQVIAQYGPDGVAVEIIGLTRKSNHRRPVRRKVAP